MTLRRQFDLLPEDTAVLDDYGLPWEVIVDKDQWVLIHDFPTPGGYNHEQAVAAIRLLTGYPRTPLDMVYFHPHLVRLDGKLIGQTAARQPIDGKEFQQWSRHRTPQNPWIVGQDNIGTHIILIENWLEREFLK